jgi:hypothetical protein
MQRLGLPHFEKKILGWVANEWLVGVGLKKRELLKNSKNNYKIFPKIW